MKATSIGILAMIFVLSACSDNALEPQHMGVESNGQTGKADVVEEPELPILDDGYLFTIESSLVLGQTDSEKTTEVSASVGGIAQVSQNGESVTLTLAPCSIKLPEVDNRVLEISDDAVGAIPAIDAQGQLELGEAGYVFTLQPSAFLAGASLDNALTDTLPTRRRDDRLVDIDQDDEAGVTLKISGYSIYGSLRLVFSAAMTEVKGSPEWAGDAALSMDFFIVDDSVPFVNVQDKLDDALAELTVDEQDNRFRLVPLAEGTELSCEGVASQLNEALPEPQVVDSSDDES